MTRKLAGELVQVVRGQSLSELSVNAKSQEAPDTSEMLARQVGRPHGAPGDGRTDDFDVMALPNFWPRPGPTGPQGQCSGEGTEIGKSKPESWICGDFTVVLRLLEEGPPKEHLPFRLETATISSTSSAREILGALDPGFRHGWRSCGPLREFILL